jgi:hypothetical protein
VSKLSRSRAPGLLGHAIEAVAHELGIGVSRADRIDGDAATRDLGGERAGEADERMLGRAIGRDIRITLEAGGRGDVDDASAAALDHARQHRLAGMDGAHDVHVPHPVEHRRLAFVEPAGLGRAGIVDQDGDRPPLAFGGADAPTRLHGIGDVGDLVAGRIAGRDRFPQRRFAAADHGDAGAGARERAGDRAADPATAAGDQRVLACQGHRLLPPPP